MLLGGDEFARTQAGNNNAYCQDNELTWFDWGQVARAGELIEFVAAVIDLRHKHPVFRRRQFFRDASAAAGGRVDLDWYRPDGGVMTAEDWGASYARAITMALSGTTGDTGSADDSFLVMLNAWWEPLEFELPESLRGFEWHRELDRAQDGPTALTLDGTGSLTVSARSLVPLRAAGPRTSP